MTHKRLISVPKIALYEPDIPQNTAAIVRTCSCLGAILEIIEPCGFLFNDKRFKRVVMDYLDESMIKIYNSAEEFFDKKKPNRRDFILTATTAAGAVGVGAAAWPLIDQMNPDASVKALASTEVDISGVEPGQSITVLWRGKPVFIKRRTKEEIDSADG